MKLTKETLKRIIKEELDIMMNEGGLIEETVAYIKNGERDADVGTFERAHKEGQVHLIMQSYSAEQDPISVLLPAGTDLKQNLGSKMASAISRDLSQTKRITPPLEKQIKSATQIDDSKPIYVIFKV